LVLATIASARAQRPLISTNPETPFKLATFEVGGKVRVGIVIGARILDIEGAHTTVIQELALRGMPAMPRDMRTLIEAHARNRPARASSIPTRRTSCRQGATSIGRASSRS